MQEGRLAIRGVKPVLLKDCQYHGPNFDESGVVLWTPGGWNPPYNISNNLDFSMKVLASHRTKGQPLLALCFQEKTVFYYTQKAAVTSLWWIFGDH